MRYEKSCGGVVFTRVDGEVRYVIIQQIAEFHGFPKGHMEGEETEEETALREIWEEVGLKVQLVEGFRQVDEYRLPSKRDTMKQVVYFLAEYQDQTIVIQEEELFAAELLTYEEARNALDYDSAKQILEKANDFLTKKREL